LGREPCPSRGESEGPRPARSRTPAKSKTSRIPRDGAYAPPRDEVLMVRNRAQPSRPSVARSLADRIVGFPIGLGVQSKAQQMSETISIDALMLREFSGLSKGV
jgi:hypothetical protein